MWEDGGSFHKLTSVWKKQEGLQIFMADIMRLYK